MTSTGTNRQPLMGDNSIRLDQTRLIQIWGIFSHQLISTVNVR